LLPLLLITTCRISQQSFERPCEHIGDSRQLTGMSLKQANYREIIASFIGKIPHVKGWWYRLPSRVAPTQDGQPLPFDAILPHMGTLFGITELVMWVILYEMGCYKKKGNSFIINTQGWDNLKYEFKMKPFLEVSTSQLDGRRCTHIRLGFPTDKPIVIWKKYESRELKNIQPPPAAVRLQNL
jgi:hypothetical protein